jgi:hypothetical protein
MKDERGGLGFIIREQAASFPGGYPVATAADFVECQPMAFVS